MELSNNFQLPFTLFSKKMLLDQLKIPEEAIDKYLTILNDPKKREGITWQFTIPKANGKLRELRDTEKGYKIVLKKINRMLNKIKLPSEFHGAVKGKSTVSNANPHVNRPYLIKIDVKDFYPSLRFKNVKVLFQKIGCTPKIAGLLAKLTTLDGKIQQGYPTSSTIANLYLAVFCYSDLKKVISENNYRMTIWIDDLTISSKTFINKKCRKDLFSAIERGKLKINRTKLEILGPRDKKLVTGNVVNEKVNPPRKNIEYLENELFTASKIGLAAFMNRYHVDRVQKALKKSPARSINDIGKHYFRGKLNQIKAVNSKKFEKILSRKKTIIEQLDIF